MHSLHFIYHMNAYENENDNRKAVKFIVLKKYPPVYTKLALEFATNIEVSVDVTMQIGV